MRWRYKVGLLFTVVVFSQVFLIAGSSGELVETGNETGIETQDPDGVVVDETLLNESGDTTLVVRLTNASESPAAGTLDSDHSSIGTDQLKTHAESTQETVEQFASTDAAVEIENQFWLTNAVVLTVDTDRVSVDQLARLEHVERIHADFRGRSRLRPLECRAGDDQHRNRDVIDGCHLRRRPGQRAGSLVCIQHAG